MGSLIGIRYIIVVAASDPVAQGVAERWGTPPPTGVHVDGAALRAISPDVWLWRRPGPHIRDNGLDARLPDSVRTARPTFVFPSIHRSTSGTECLTVHPLGNVGPTAEVGGYPATLTPASPRLMADALRKLAEGGRSLGMPATCEATHHGPALEVPGFFMEIGYGSRQAPPPAALDLLAATLPTLSEDPADRIALAIGGGHYAPHFSQLVLERRWAVGHILSRHSIEGIAPAIARRAWELTPAAEGILPARVADYSEADWSSMGPRLKDGDAPRR
jgi:D-tyrosyl-tRNA(Tyr) deacylase